MTSRLPVFFIGGLAAQSSCMWVTSQPLYAQQARDAKIQEVPKLEDYIHQRQMEILDYSPGYTAGGGFESDRVLQGEWRAIRNSERKRVAASSWDRRHAAP